jgi:DNA-binding transcriptional LysR family regulator
MEIYQLRTFISVARLGHLTRAAERLHLTQSAVSKQIKSLEEEWGFPLFERTASGVVLTKSGAALLKQAEAAVESVEALRRLATSLRSEVVATIRLGTIIDPEFIRLGELLGGLLRFHPHIDVRLVHGISGWVAEEVLDGRLDAGYALGEIGSDVLAARQLHVLTYVVIAPCDWQQRWPHLANTQRSGQSLAETCAQLAQFKWIGTPTRSSQHRLVKSMFEEHGLRLNHTTVEADQEASMLDLVRQGLGLCMMRENLAEAAQERGEVIVWPGIRRLCPLSFIHPRARAQEPIFAALHSVLDGVWPPA